MHRLMTRWHSLLACLGLLALTLALGGPLLSQTQRLLEAEHATHGAGHHRGDQATYRHGASDAAAVSHTDFLAACDYCTLFLHMPGLLLSEVVAAALHPTSSTPLAGGPWRLVERERYRLYRGRAPPLHAFD
ncbi:DUF2946 family protein [Billgrantia pellis]|uniref:DUF2946 family protein n=1 Tax=Billgrantia pellis TaxID=2606936 RepID=UPI0016597950|nr:DUF2946 family protein [Halomonas pellis]